MAVVEIGVDDFSKSEVPPVCVFSGVPSDNVFRFRFGGVTGGLPVDRDVLASLARLRKVVLILAATSVACFLWSVTAGSSLPTILALGFILIALSTTFTARRRLVTGTVIGDQLRLENVHPAFASAVNGPLGKCSTCPTLDDCPNKDKTDCE